MKKEDLTEVARRLVAPNKGVLAADESTPTIKKRFEKIQVESNEENRRVYRQMLFTTPGLSEFISGVILFEETLRQETDDGVLFPELLNSQRILSGIKVDKGTKPLEGDLGEKVTEGLDGLRSRLEEYRELGASFTKWRAVIKIGRKIPSSKCINVNVQSLARFAALSQESGLVPIVEPEILMDGDHSIERCEEVTRETLEALFGALYINKVSLEGICLKPNMVLSGVDSSAQASTAEIAKATIRCFLRSVPAAVPGIVFLSGGQSEIEASRNLNAMNLIGGTPWQLSFSFGRALQASTLVTWGGNPKRIKDGQNALYHRAKCNSAARSGNYDEKWD